MYTSEYCRGDEHKRILVSIAGDEFCREGDMGVRSLFGVLGLMLTCSCSQAGFGLGFVLLPRMLVFE